MSDSDSDSSLRCTYVRCGLLGLCQLLYAHAAYERCVTCASTCHVQHCTVWHIDRLRQECQLLCEALLCTLLCVMSKFLHIWKVVLSIFVITLRLKFIFRRFGTLCLFYLHRRCKHANQTKPRCQLWVETCADCKSTSPCLLTIHAFDRIAVLFNRNLNSNRGYAYHNDIKVTLRALTGNVKD